MFNGDMHPVTIFFRISLLFLADVAPLLVFDSRILACAVAGRVSATPYRVAALLGGAAFGFVIQMTVVFLLVDATTGTVVFLVAAPSGCVGAAVAAGICYQYLWMRTARDPDYEEPRPPPASGAA